MDWGLALKNVLRNRARTSVTVCAIAAGCASLIVTAGFIRGAIQELQESYIRAFLGHIQVYAEGFSEKGSIDPFSYMIPDPEGVGKRISGLPGVLQVAPRLEFFGLLSVAETSMPCLAQGVDPRKEISPLLKVIKGRDLAGSEGYEAIIGEGLAKALHAKEGDSLALLANTPGGGLNGLDLKVVGVFRSGTKAYDDRALRIPIRTAQGLLRSEGIQRFTVFLQDTGQAPAAVVRLRQALSGDGLEVKAWYELDDADFVGKLVNFYDRLFLVLKIIIMVVVILSVFNTMNMAALERIGEVGTIMALGMKTKEVLLLFIAEGLILGLLGSAVGLGLGYGLARLLSQVGVPMGVPPSMTVEWIARFPVVPRAFAFAFVQAMSTCLVSSVYPAWKSSRLEIAEALRHNV